MVGMSVDKVKAVKKETLRVFDESCEPGTHFELEIEKNTLVQMIKVTDKK